MKRRLLWLLVWMIALSGVCAAEKMPDSGSGSISVQICTEAGEYLPHARVEVYRVGEPFIRENDLRFALTEEFVDSGISLEELGDSALAKTLETYAKGKKIKPWAKATTDDSGTVMFADVPVGLYLVRQNGFSKKYKTYSTISSFTVSVPMMNANGTGWQYVIEARPKVGALPVPTPPPGSSMPDDPSLPQTGMLRWPIPVLSVGGLLLFTAGWVLTFGGKRDRDA